ncbi:MAG: type II toxin-antitoxin system HicB family antitoxin [Candidatus Omnitrophica bacterium]|nr:hypothetical protein [bacterium]NUN96562.1 type II toxin-antitoxin system HicB family antitoxin [Candidatus Omnitrophota bacterium]
MRTIRAQFLHRDEWWVAWTDDVPGALTQGRTLEEARENLKDAIAAMEEPVDWEDIPFSSESIIQEEIEV